ncbi:MAG: four helix bundle protein [Candidatus Moranbacteria bacterium]|nr:four helix bundle protein [Candidatus Moranbacteria bacterium]
MSNKIQKEKNQKYDLIERTAIFGENVIDFIKTVDKNEITRPLINQIVRSATSIGANYMEADCAESKKDFEHKMGICRKEAKETMHWFRMIVCAINKDHETCRLLWKEAQEFVFIFSAIIKNSKAAEK